MFYHVKIACYQSSQFTFIIFLKNITQDFSKSLSSLLGICLSIYLSKHRLMSHVKVCKLLCNEEGAEFYDQSLEST